MFLCLQVFAQSSEPQVERMYTFTQIDELDSEMNVTETVPAKGVIVIGYADGSKQMAFAVNDEAVCDVTVIASESAEEDGVPYVNYACKSNLEDNVMYSISEFLSPVDGRTPTLYIVATMDPSTNEIVEIVQFNGIQVVE